MDIEFWPPIRLSSKRSVVNCLHSELPIYAVAVFLKRYSCV
jgi:hypothetical protein